MLAALRERGVAVYFVYLAEAHADDVWPLGYGISAHRDLADRWAHAEAFLDRHVSLRAAVDGVFVDAMEDPFLHRNGAWPERYFLVRDGAVVLSPCAGDEALPALETILAHL